MIHRFLANDDVRRAIWTLGQAAIGFLIAESAGLPPAYAIPIAASLSAAKGALAKHVQGGADV